VYSEIQTESRQVQGRTATWTSERKMFRMVTQKSSFIAWATDEQGRCFYLSPEWYAFTGDVEDCTGFNWLTLVHPEDVVAVRQAFFDANDNRYAFGMAYRLSHSSGEYRSVWDVGLPKIDDNGTFSGFFGATCVIEQEAMKVVDQSCGSAAGAAFRTVLTPREREILTLVSEGNTTEMVASVLGITGRTVDTHLANAGSKLGTLNRVHTVATALRRNEI
jgi:PAS domain S-box-containing protein